MHTYGSALALIGTGVPDHLVADAEVPVLTGPQAQGDLLVFRRAAPSTVEWRALPAAGLRLVDGEATGNTHWLHAGFASPGVRWAASTLGPQRLGFLFVPPGETALLIHTDEHGANGVGPGTYVVHRKREQVQIPDDEPEPGPAATRLVAD
ncbi:hypothetical protein [Virgisporangium aurantiacum]|uniref:Uncharacterized protein n=1 Tax=Virgisporangium aurantiacum TaxID=175570 RepID=A0A8J3ZDF3_9ACTN|nr:hypothetical protein [Virgisporangium aurantiacum]GIJ60768.1 hypothetical protein Vau01_082840 [Virgisporangium aurantiacum]